MCASTHVQDLRRDKLLGSDELDIRYGLAVPFDELETLFGISNVYNVNGMV